MDFRWLQDFLSLAELGNFTEAAEARHSSQPAFSRRIQSLEEAMGVELIDRSCYPTRLTSAGERFRTTAADILRQMSDTRAELHGQPTSEEEVLTFALPHTLATFRFPGWWTAWRKASGASSCRLIASNVHDAVTAHVAGLADVLICFHHAQQPIFLDPEQPFSNRSNADRSLLGASVAQRTNHAHGFGCVVSHLRAPLAHLEIGRAHV